MSDVISRVRSVIGVAPDEPELGTGLDLADALDVLANERRRLAIRFVADHDGGEFELDDIVDYVATGQYGAGFDRPERKRVYIASYQTHIDILVDADVIRPVPNEANTFRQGETATALDTVLETAEDVLEVSN